MSTIVYTIPQSTGTCRRLRDVPNGATVEEIDGKEIVGRCEGCGRYVRETSEHYVWADGIVTCARCGGPAPTVARRKGAKRGK